MPMMIVARPQCPVKDKELNTEEDIIESDNLVYSRPQLPEKLYP